MLYMSVITADVDELVKRCRAVLHLWKEIEAQKGGDREDLQRELCKCRTDRHHPMKHLPRSSLQYNDVHVCVYLSTMHFYRLCINPGIKLILVLFWDSVCENYFCEDGAVNTPEIKGVLCRLRVKKTCSKNTNTECADL